MWTLAQYDLIPIGAALLIGLVTGWWRFRRGPAGARPGAGPPSGIMTDTRQEEPPR